MVLAHTAIAAAVMCLSVALYPLTGEISRVAFQSSTPAGGAQQEHRSARANASRRGTRRAGKRKSCEQCPGEPTSQRTGLDLPAIPRLEILIHSPQRNIDHRLPNFLQTPSHEVPLMMPLCEQVIPPLPRGRLPKAAPPAPMEND